MRGAAGRPSCHCTLARLSSMRGRAACKGGPLPHAAAAAQPRRSAAEPPPCTALSPPRFSLSAEGALREEGGGRQGAQHEGGGQRLGGTVCKSRANGRRPSPPVLPGPAHIHPPLSPASLCPCRPGTRRRRPSMRPRSEAAQVLLGSPLTDRLRPGDGREARHARMLDPPPAAALTRLWQRQGRF